MRSVVGAVSGVILCASGLLCALVADASAAPAARGGVVVAPVARTTGSATAAAGWRLGVDASGVLRTRRHAAPIPEARLVERAVRADASTAEVPASAYRVTHVRFSSDREWAAADLAPTDADALDPAKVVLRKQSGSWRVVELGTDGVGCGAAPARTLRALSLTCSAD